jgi:hypothetical protein
MAAMDNGSGCGNDVKDASITMATMLVRRGHGNNGKDSKRAIMTGNNQPAQQKDMGVDKRSGV